MDEIEKLAEAFVDMELTDAARELLLHCRSIRHSFPPETHFLLGWIFELSDDLPAARSSYEAALTLRPEYQRAQHRLTALALEFPNRVNVGEIGEARKTRNMECHNELYDDYQSALADGDSEETLKCVVELITFTFSMAAVLEPEEFLWKAGSLKTPYAIEKGLKVYQVSAPVLASGKVTVWEFYDAAFKGCQLANELRRWVNTKFHDKLLFGLIIVRLNFTEKLATEKSRLSFRSVSVRVNPTDFRVFPLL